MADDFLSSLGAGLRGAGAILSAPVYEQQNREQDIALREMAVRREQLGRALLLGIQQGSVDPNNEQVKMTLQRLGVPGTAFGPSPQAQAASAGLRADSSLRERLRALPSPPQTSQELLDVVMKGDPTGPFGERLLGIASTMQNREAIQAQKQRDYELRVDTLTQRAEEREREAARKEASDADRAEARREATAARLQIAQMMDSARREGLALRRETAGASREDKKVRDQEKADAKLERDTAPVRDLIGSINLAISQIEKNPDVVGARGMLERGKEFITTFRDPYAQTPGAEFQQNILGIQSKWRKLPTVAANRFKADAAKIDDQVKGIGKFTNAAAARNSLIQLRDDLENSLRNRGADVPEAPADPARGKIVTKITSDAEYEALPSGTEFVGPDGKRRRKP